jgi:hypothetical protein
LLKKESYIEKMIKMNKDIYKDYVVPKVGFGLTNVFILLLIIILIISIYFAKLKFYKNYNIN